jgi:hypothetical protein
VYASTPTKHGGSLAKNGNTRFVEFRRFLGLEVIVARRNIAAAG